MDHIATGPHGTTFVGPQAVNLYAAVTLRLALALYMRTGMKVNRAYTPTNMLLAATRITGRTYKRGKAGMGAAIIDLSQRIDTARASVPVVDHTDAARP